MRPSCSVRRDAAAAVLAADQSALAIDGVAVGVATRLAKDSCVAGAFVEAQHPVVGDVGEHQRARRREIDRALGPAAAGPQRLQTGVAVEAGAKALVEDFIGAKGHRDLRIGEPCGASLRRLEKPIVSGQRAFLSSGLLLTDFAVFCGLAQ